jgi:hypothetical protein
VQFEVVTERQEQVFGRRYVRTTNLTDIPTKDLSALFVPLKTSIYKILRPLISSKPFCSITKARD